MRFAAVLGGLGVVSSAVLVGQVGARAGSDRGDGGIAGIGPDVIVGSLPNFQKWGTVSGVTAYSIATTSCNIGDAELTWIQSNNQHPVIAQNLYRLQDGRFEQIGMSWLKHGFCALQGTLCGPCTPAGPGCFDKLGVGCSDPYDSSLNGQQGNLGPRSEVNASTGFFPYPFTAPPAPATIGRRLQVPNADLDPASNVGALYFAEGIYIHPEDAAGGNATNNASYRATTVGSFSGGGWNLTMSGPTVQQLPAIHAWKAQDPEVQIVNADVLADGRFVIGYRVTEVGPSAWWYEFAIMNLTSHRSAGSFSIPIPEGVVISESDFRHINHHSGEPYATDPWSITVADGKITWATTPHAVNPNANALRWGTLYNFRFVANTPPQNATATIGMFRPNGPSTKTFAAVGPSPAPSCEPADLNCDGVVDGSDLGVLLAAWGTPDADLNGDGTTDGADIGLLLGAWG